MENVLDQAYSLARQLVPLTLVFGLLAWAVKRRGFPAALRRVRGEATTNLLLFFFNGFLAALLFTPAAKPFLALFDNARPLAAFWSSVPQVVTLVTAILLIDLVAYWRHRLEHHPLLWRIHATHHADTAIHWLSVQRKHPIGKLLSMLADNLLVLLAGVPFWAIVAAGFLRTIWGYFIHADLPWTLGIFGRVLISPAAHRLHHIRDETLMGTNYGNTVTLWDRLFGTYCDPTPYLDCETGIEEGTRGFIGELMRPFEARYRRGGGASGETTTEEAAA